MLAHGIGGLVLQSACACRRVCGVVRGIAARRWRRLLLCLLIAVALASGARAAEPTITLGNSLESINFRDLPFLVIPVVGTDPDAGTVVGIMPVFLTSDEQREIRRIIAPDVIRDPNFGYGTRARIFGYPSEDTRWYVIGGVKQRVEREFAGVYTTGLTRRDDWSFSLETIYDRNGTRRFYGIGNQSSLSNETTYVNEVAFLEGRAGRNLTPDWQLAYTLRPRHVSIGAGVLDTVPSIQTLFPVQGQLGSGYDVLNMLSVTYDTRDSLSIPDHGVQVIGYVGYGAGAFGQSVSYSVMGIDVRHFWPVAKNLTIASHAALRYMPSEWNAPFWALSSLGGDRSVLAGAQPLRAFGANRFIDRNSFSASLELRYRVLDLQLFATNLTVELAPFVDVGRVFHNLGDNPLAPLHTAVGVGFRAFARPFIVGYVDVGYGSDGAAVFSGINYPF